MSEDFRAAFYTESAPAGDTAPATPETPVETLAAAPEPEAEGTPAADTAPATGETQEWRFDAAEFDQAHPELAPYRKQIQASYTKAQQELKEKYGAYEAVDPADLQWLQRLYQTAAVSPQAAAQMIEQARQQILGPQYQPEAPAQEYIEEFATDKERELHERLLRQEAWQQQQIEARNWAVINQQREAISKEFGTIPESQWNQAAAFCTRNGLAADQIGVAWKGLFGAEAARRLGRDEAASVVAAKAAMTPGPSGITTPAITPKKSVEDAGSLREAFEMSRIPG